MPLTKTLQVLKLTTLNRKPKNYWFFPGSMNNRKFLPFPPRRDENDDCSPDYKNTDKSFSKNPFFRNWGFLIDPKFLEDRNIKDDCPPVSKPSTCDHKNRAFSNPFFHNRGFLIDPKGNFKRIAKRSSIEGFIGVQNVLCIVQSIETEGLSNDFFHMWS